MRDYLPTGTVKMLVDRCRLDGDPHFNAPELEKLAERYAHELLAAPPREPNDEDPDASEPAHDPAHMGADMGKPEEPTPPPVSVGGRPYKTKREADRQKASDETIARFRDAIRDAGRCKPSDLDPLGYSDATRARVTRRLRDQGLVDIEYDGHQRMLIWVGDGDPAPEDEQPNAEDFDAHDRLTQTSEPDHDDTGEGDVPADPEGDAEDKRPAEPGSDGAAPAARQEPPAAPPRRPRSSLKPAPRPATTDLELMAMVSDYLNEADGWVWPRELEQRFKLNGTRRRHIIGMLDERSRIWIDGAGGPKVRYAYRGGLYDRKAPAVGAPAGDGDEGLGESDGHFRDPARERQEAAQLEEAATLRGVDAHLEPVREWAKNSGTFSSRQLRDVFPMSPATCSRLLAKLVNGGDLKRNGDRGPAVTYEFAAPAPPPPANGNGRSSGKRPLDGAGRNENGTLEGRAFGILQGGAKLSIDEMATRLGVSREVAKAILGRLYSQGEVRPRSSGGIMRYAAL